ncbi:MAG: hypothetical protein JKY23_01415, partial [Nitrospinaceae bacterium]|nr:hypothetical protein [Nitrospinaceae bacterium]
MKRHIFLAVIGAIGLAGVATPSAGEEEDAVDYRIGEEVDRICFGRNINGWKTVDRLDDVILLKQSVNHWYYVELLGGCRYSALRSALSIGIDSRFSGGCIRSGDTIIIEDSAFPLRCTVQHIYEWDEDATAPEDKEEEEGLEENE